MMGRALLLLLVVLVVATPAGAFASRTFAADTSLCTPILAHVNPGVDLPCPRARHTGVFTSGGCADNACTLTLQMSSRGDGLPLVAKSLQAMLVLGEEEFTFPVCAAHGPTALACTGETTVSIPLATGDCIDLRARTLLTDLVEAPPTLPVQADSGVTLCRSDAEATIA